MIVITELRRLNGETITQMARRIISDRKNIGSWDKVRDILNKLSGYNYSESYWRHGYRDNVEFKNNDFYYDTSDDKFEMKLMEDEKTKIIKEREKLDKEKRKFFDQRREYNKQITSDARFDNLTEKIIDTVKDINNTLPLISNEKKYYVNNDKEALLCLSDWHYGMVTDNIWNKYNVAICKERIKKTIDYAIEYLVLNKIDKVTILILGDMANGAIHTSSRVKSEEDVCDQLIHVSELLAESIDNISWYVNKINVVFCYGNHMRTVQKKENSIDSDNMEKIIPWWLSYRFIDNNKITITESEFSDFTKITILNNNICCVHGNGFNFKNIGSICNNLFTEKYGVPINYTISGDKHHLEEFEQFGIESILVRSLCGTDDYANKLHLYSKPGQTLIIFNKNGRESTYHIPLD